MVHKSTYYKCKMQLKTVQFIIENEKRNIFRIGEANHNNYYYIHNVSINYCINKNIDTIHTKTTLKMHCNLHFSNVNGLLKLWHVCSKNKISYDDNHSTKKD